MKSKYILSYFILFYLILSCKDKKVFVKDNIEINKQNKEVSTETETKVYQKKEYLSEMMYINKEYPLEGNKVSILNFIPKKIDSTNNNGYECGSILEEEHKVIFFLNSEVEISETKYVFRKINFITSNYTLRHGTIVFSKEYSLSDFKNNFPISFIKNKTKEEGKIIITVLSHELTDDSYIFTFKNDKLIEFHYFFPC